MSSSRRSIFEWWSDGQSSRRSSGDAQGLVVVNPAPIDGERVEEVPEEEEIELPAINEFKFKAIISHVQPLVDAVAQDVEELVGSYRAYLETEFDGAANTQRRIAAKMAAVDQLVTQTLSTTLGRVNKSVSYERSLKGVDSLAVLTEQAYNSLSSILSLLQDIDSFLPPSERLGSVSSPHKHHYPRLHNMLLSLSPKSQNGQLLASGRLPRRSVSMSALSAVATSSETDYRSSPLLLRTTHDRPVMNLRTIDPRIVEEPTKSHQVFSSTESSLRRSSTRPSTDREQQTAKLILQRMISR